MMFSFIVPVYNVEGYVRACLESIEKQTYEQYEVLIVNDGSEDASVAIIEDFIKGKEKFRLLHKENGGLSDARNAALAHVQGDYIVFVDSDDTIHPHLLARLYEEIEAYPTIDVIKFQCQYVSEEGNVLQQFHDDPFHNVCGIEAFSKLLQTQTLEPAWSYTYRKDYWMSQNFMFRKGTYHEDFGLIPFVVFCASSVSSLSFVGYNYLQRAGSIMNDDHAQKNRKKAWDTLLHYDCLLQQLEQNKYTSEEVEEFQSFLANAVLSKASKLHDQDFKSYLKEIQKRKIYNRLCERTIGQRFKKRWVKWHLESYLNIMCKR